MLSILNGLTKAAIAVVVTPVAVVADVVTLGGALTDRHEPYTASTLNAAANQLENIINKKG
jgi:hypothetical protein